eukprot:CAMPEP_0167810156 /NCGR_PEP_ID=MMETSP0111_2-20121227/24210_1 /TAXON_ID=91324 /ORGANISM="Lotharella globosa, Strain CCCM811" /LENGTH=49 /DNA_ID=CAMNT_0007708655 /DNA_START=510 /DNA_END=659 /DNA_ORIENTATION=+
MERTPTDTPKPIPELQAVLWHEIDVATRFMQDETKSKNKAEEERDISFR